MAWIPSDVDMGQHPKIKRFARELGVSVPTAVGHLHLFWHYCMKFISNGYVTNQYVTDVTDAALWDGNAQKFFDSLKSCGLLDEVDGELYIHDWEQYGGKILDKKNGNAERQKKYRETHKPKPRKAQTHQRESETKLSDDKTSDNDDEKHSNSDITVTSQESNTTDKNRIDKNRIDKDGVRTHDAAEKEIQENSFSDDPIQKFPEITDAVFDALGSLQKSRYAMGTMSATRKIEIQKIVGMLAHENRTVDEIILFRDNWPKFLNKDSPDPPTPRQMLDEFDRVVNWKPRGKVSMTQDEQLKRMAEIRQQQAQGGISS